jgi:hypothetical protein
MWTHEIEDAECVKESDLALCIESDDVGESFWVPKSVVHDDSDVFHEGDCGCLVVALWWAEKELL